METTLKPTLGILGGMGPRATVDFLGKIVFATPASCDQDHLPVHVCSIPQIPDRTDAILARGASPLPQLMRSLRVLISSGVNLIAIPCNTAHHWYQPLQDASEVEIIHIVNCVVDELMSEGLGGCAVGLLATTGTIQAKIYQGRLAQAGFRLVVPSDNEQRVIMSLISSVKSGASRGEIGDLDDRIDALERAGADATVLACTELPLLARVERTRAVIDSTAALARGCIRWAFASSQ